MRGNAVAVLGSDRVVTTVYLLQATRPVGFITPLFTLSLLATLATVLFVGLVRQLVPAQ